jgi:trehalose 6-phosphate phosphatase
VIGSHGAEDESGVDPRARRARARVRAWRVELERALGDVPGTSVEDKDDSLAVHYRAARDRARARRAVMAALARLRGARVVPGKCVLNVVPAGSPNKGQALERALRRMGVARALYVGDDHTDEDVFARAPRRRILTVRVGQRQRSRAELHLRDQGEVDELLGLLLAELGAQD